MHTGIFGWFQSNQLKNLIHFVNESGLLEVKENLCPFSCLVFHPKLSTIHKNLLIEFL